MKFFVNENCIGCGLCNSICEEVFEMSEQGNAVACDCCVENQTQSLALQAKEQCPVAAIEIV